MGDKKFLKYKDYYGEYYYDADAEIWYGKTSVQDKTITFSGENRVQMEKDFHKRIEIEEARRETE